MATVYDFPVGAASTPLPPAIAPARPLPVLSGRRGEYGLGDVARALSLLDYSPARIIEKLRALALHSGMPLPRNPRIVKGVPVRGARSIHRRSKWDAGAFDAWLDGRGPTGAAMAAPPVPAAVRAAMRDAALRLAGGRHGMVAANQAIGNAMGKRP